MQEYLVGFRIFEGRNLQSEDGNPCDPFVVVDCGGFSYQTETLEARGSLAPWNEHSTWPHIWLHPKEFDSSFVEFKVYARHWFTRNYLIGKATLQLSYINKRQHHLCARRSLQLRRDESPAVAGTLTVTVFVLKPGEMAPSLALQTSEPVDVGDEGQVKQSDQDGLETAVLSKTVDAQPASSYHRHPHCPLQKPTVSKKMGLFFSKIWAHLQGPKEMRILMLGLDAAGKTTILYKLKFAEVVVTIPTIGFNVETVEYKNINFTVWDVGGQDQIRRLWGHYYRGTNGLIYVVDSADRDRIFQAKEELEKMLGEQEMKDAALLVLANKQDLPNAMTSTEIMQKLDLEGLNRDRKWFIQSTVAPTGDGLYEGLDWLSRTLSAR
eukprot:s548_g8.t1